VFARSGAVGDDFLARRNFLVTSFDGFHRHVYRAFDVFLFLSDFGARIDKNGISGVKIFFRIGERDARSVVRVPVFIGFRSGIFRLLGSRFSIGLRGRGRIPAGGKTRDGECGDQQRIQNKTHFYLQK
jgi:hypothetical protein